MLPGADPRKMAAARYGSGLLAATSSAVSSGAAIATTVILRAVFFGKSAFKRTRKLARTKPYGHNAGLRTIVSGENRRKSLWGA